MISHRARNWSSGSSGTLRKRLRERLRSSLVVDRRRLRARLVRTSTTLALRSGAWAKVNFRLAVVVFFRIPIHCIGLVLKLDITSISFLPIRKPSYRYILKHVATTLKERQRIETRENMKEDVKRVDEERIGFWRHFWGHTSSQSSVFSKMSTDFECFPR